jgi:hypothetical protein
MNNKALKKIKRELLEMRKSPHGHSADEFISIAQKLGRKKDGRGKEPTYVRELDPALSPPLSIPRHGSKDLKAGTAKSIIDALLDDVSHWEEYLSELEEDDNESN